MTIIFSDQLSLERLVIVSHLSHSSPALRCTHAGDALSVSRSGMAHCENVPGADMNKVSLTSHVPCTERESKCHTLAPGNRH